MKKLEINKIIRIKQIKSNVNALLRSAVVPQTKVINKIIYY